ncbi:hypothetical protein ACPXCO_37335 [Streptomyces cyaneofuscatus]|uniref:hypothetical protein n=1 Tax=Streptomyces cyaneofuscatus TaxID=66883 RepID=UPI003CF06E96
MPWAKRWEAASALLGALGFTVFILALVARAEGAVFTGLAVAVMLLWGLAAGCVVAEKAARRREAQEVRRAWRTKGLLVEARMWAPRTVWIAWVVGGCLPAASALTVWAVQTRLDSAASARPEEIVAQAQELYASAAIVMSTALVVSVLCGAVHAVARRRRRDAEHARVLDAAQQLTAPADSG